MTLRLAALKKKLRVAVDKGLKKSMEQLAEMSYMEAPRTPAQDKPHLVNTLRVEKYEDGLGYKVMYGGDVYEMRQPGTKEPVDYAHEIHDNPMAGQTQGKGRFGPARTGRNDLWSRVGNMNFLRGPFEMFRGSALSVLGKNVKDELS